MLIDAYSLQLPKDHLVVKIRPKWNYNNKTNTNYYYIILSIYNKLLIILIIFF